MTIATFALPSLWLIIAQPPTPETSSPEPPTVEETVSDEQRTEPASPTEADGEPVENPERTSDDDAASDATPAEPRYDAMEHLSRAQALKVAGELSAAEAEVSVAISLDPEDAAAYLERAQIRMALADGAEGDSPSALRTRAALLRDAADDVEGYLDRAKLDGEGATWFRAREAALRREADALDPPAPTVQLAPTAPVVRPAPTIPPPPARVGPTDRSGADVDHRRRSASLWGSGAALSIGAVGLASASLRIHRSCDPSDLCRVNWKTKPALLAPAAVLTAMGTTSIVLGVLDAPGMSKPRVRKATAATTLALGGTATVLGTVTAIVAGVRWYGPISPSDDDGLSDVMTLGNLSFSSFTAALPLLSAGITAALSARRSKKPGHNKSARRFARR